MAAPRLVVGLGNPGPRYERTRHNAGFRLVERLAGEDAVWKDFSGLGRWTKARGLMLGEPLTYMNESGRFVAALSRFHKIAPGEILVCFDDVALPLGRLRLRPAGSSGGQKGMESILSVLGTKEVPRLRIGVGPQPPGWDSTDFVLGRFTAAEEKVFSGALDAAAEAVGIACGEGLEAAMNAFNAAPS